MHVHCYLYILQTVFKENNSIQISHSVSMLFVTLTTIITSILAPQIDRNHYNVFLRLVLKTQKCDVHITAKNRHGSPLTVITVYFYK